MKPPSFIHVDLDASWAVMRHFGYEVQPRSEPDVLFDQGMPRLLALFRESLVPATLFIVGADLAVPSRASLLRQAVAEGHEPANHSTNHPEGFGDLPDADLAVEIRTCHERICAELGKAPLGFRAPNFELSPRVLPLLRELGYWYDTSILGTSVAPLLRGYHRRRSARPTPSRYLGDPSSLFAPRFPYFPREHSPHRTGDSNLLELPVAVAPYTRLPVHGSYLRVYGSIGRRLFEWTVRWYANRGLPFTFLLHLSDVAPQQREPALQGEPGNSLSDAGRMELYHWCIEVLQHYTTVRTSEAVLAERYGLRRPPQ